MGFILPETVINPEQQYQDFVAKKALLRGSFLDFTRTFFELREKVPFRISNPVGRESHHRIICRELKDVFLGKTQRLLINIPPRYSKTELVIHFVAWSMGRYPDSNFIYASYSKSVAVKQTQTIRDIMTMPEYKLIFGDVEIDRETRKKDDFMTNHRGGIFGAGSQGPILSRGAGRMCDRFGGALVIDDPHHPKEVESDLIRQNDIDWFYGTAVNRLNYPRRTPIIAIMQRLREGDMSDAFIAEGGWRHVCLPALDDNGFALDPDMHTADELREMIRVQPYFASSRYQQHPLPAGGGLFKTEWFTTVDLEPDFIATFVSVDTAETDKNYNDATAFSFFGIYKMYFRGKDTGLLGLHWIDCAELRIEASDLEDAFSDFYLSCMHHRCKPVKVIVEAKSTGVTLASTLKKMPGLQVLTLKPKDSKATRFMACEKYLSTHRITLPTYGKHTVMVIEHCSKIVANMTHRFDDIADTLAQAIKCALIDDVIVDAASDAEEEMLADFEIDVLGVVNSMAEARQSGWIR